MLQRFRTEFNERQFSATRYEELLRRLDERTRTKIDFRISETPCFFDRALLEEMCETGRVLTHQLVDSAEYMQRSEAAIPERGVHAAV